MSERPPLKLTKAERAGLWDALLRPPALTARAKEAAKRYRQMGLAQKVLDADDELLRAIADSGKAPE